MTRAELEAVLAGMLAAAFVVELAGALAERSLARAAAAGPSRSRARRLVATAAGVGRRAGLPLRPPADLAARMAAAGLPSALGAAEIMAAKLGAGVIAVLLAIPPAAGAPGRLGPVVLLGAPAAAFLLPDYWLRRRARQRAMVMSEELPEVLDLLRVVVAAGMPVGRALGEVGRRRGGLLAGELARAAALLAVGVPRGEALRRLRMRCPVRAAGALVVAIDRADRHGVPLAPALAALAADARAERSRKLADRAAKAAPKIQLVVALLLVPAVLLLVAAVMVHALR